MRIYSDFTDYYDVVQKTSFSQEPVYNRIERSIEEKIDPAPNMFQYPILDKIERDKNPISSYRFGYVAFCGKIYYFAMHGSALIGDEKFYYSYDRMMPSYLKQMFEKNGGDCKINDNNNAPVVVRLRDWDHFKINGPTRHRIFTSAANRPLKHFEFFRVKDPYTAFQDIEMWLSNKAVPEKPIPTPDDKTMRDIKGFNKFSFKKEKSK